MKNKFPPPLINFFSFLLIIFNSQFLILNSLQAQVPNSWTQRAAFPGTPRVSAAYFSIGGIGYMGTGQDSLNNLLNDFWKYNPSTNQWTQLTDFGGTARRGAVGFSIGGKGYIGTGFDGTDNLKDFWEYDTSNGSWTSKRDLGGATNAITRRDAASFAFNDKGYVLTGYDGTTYYNKDCWQFDGDTTWIKKADVGQGLQTSSRRWATAFAIDSIGYIGCGLNYSQDWKKDFWRYNVSTNTWTQIANFGGTGRGSAVAFSIGGKGFVGTGNDDFYYKSDFWQYDPVSNSWLQIAGFGGGAISQGIAFSIGGTGFAGLGRDSVLIRNDFWAYTPDSTIGINEQTASLHLAVVFPNPLITSALLKIDDPSFNPSNFSLMLYDMHGTMIREISMNKNSTLIERQNLSAGIYFYSVRQNSSHKIYAAGKIIFE